MFGFLGPNGAGKTTTLRMLTTLLPIDGGRAVVAGADLVRAPKEVRRRIGYVGQGGGADLPATGRENLLLQGRLHGARRAEAADRASELIETLALADFVDRRAATYSGGQRRRIEVALTVVDGARTLPPLLDALRSRQITLESLSVAAPSLADPARLFHGPRGLFTWTRPGHVVRARTGLWRAAG